VNFICIRTNSVSRRYAASVDAASGIAGKLGLTTLITIVPAPSLLAYTSNFRTRTNYVTIRWVTQPTMFVLQQSTLLGSDAVSEAIPNLGASNLEFRQYLIPLVSPGSLGFFRLLSPSHNPSQTLVGTEAQAPPMTNLNASH